MLCAHAVGILWFGFVAGRCAARQRCSSFFVWLLFLVVVVLVLRQQVRCSSWKRNASVPWRMLSTDTTVTCPSSVLNLSRYVLHFTIHVLTFKVPGMREISHETVKLDAVVYVQFTTFSSCSSCFRFCSYFCLVRFPKRIFENNRNHLQ